MGPDHERCHTDQHCSNQLSLLGVGFINLTLVLKFSAGVLGFLYKPWCGYAGVATQTHHNIVRRRCAIWWDTCFLHYPRPSLEHFPSKQR